MARSLRIERPGSWRTKSIGTGEWHLGGTTAMTVPATNVAVLNSGGSEYVSREVRTNYLPAYTESYGYGLDGNLTSDGRWTYTWDVENRLVAMAVDAPVGPQISLKFDYDANGRRIRKQVWPNATWTGNPTNDLRFVYGGWNLILHSQFFIHLLGAWT